MNKLILAAAAVVLATGAASAQSDRVQVGRLSCDVDPGVGLIIGSSKGMSCEFIREGHPSEVYEGTITKVGLDIGITERTHIEWLVFALAGQTAEDRALAGTYVGASSEATVGVGLGANWLVGGLDKSFALQPWSIQGQTGLNLSVAFAALELY